ncbi:squalene epoxidase 3-like [Corylus avellana]|uniref:squalene epoxidase 3-like n=1 Tax=Corylus avellana TaxID=13451 RepID=UPI00286B8940|nr:squalene epoxidase 3-like [Corylus avellana]
MIQVSYKSTHIPSLNHPHPHSHSNSQSRPFHRRTLLYKTPFPPTISLVLRNLSTPSTPTTPRRTKTRASIPREVEGKGVLLIPTHCSSSSSSWFHYFVLWKKMVLIDQHVLWTFFASLLGFVLLYTLRRNSSKRTIKKNFPEECAEESFADRECRPVNGSGTDVIIVGAGVAGSALAYTLGKDGRRVCLIERDLTEPDRIVGELLQPGGYLKLIELGLEDCVEEIDAQRVLGYALFKDGKSAKLSYPLEKFNSDVAGRSFHNGRFIQRMREKAATLPSVKLEQGTVTSLLEENGTVRGVQYKSKDGQEHKAYAPLTIVCDGCFSNLRRTLCNPKVDVPSCFVGLVLENCQLPFENHGHVILADPSPILFYPISSTEVRCLVDVPGQKLPSVANGEMANYLKTVVGPQIPPELHDAFISAVDKGNIRTMPNRSMPADPHPTPGAVLMGDAFNMRHPLTGGGMTVALSDIVVLRDLLKPLHDLNDAPSLSKYLESFYTLRKPVASTINTLAGALYKVFSASPDQARKEMRQACFDYLSLGGSCSTGPVALLSGLNPRPLSLVLHFFAVAMYGVGRLLLPFPSPKRMWIGARLISSASGIIFPIIKAEGVRQMFFPATVPAYHRARAPPVKCNLQKDVASKDQEA